MNQQSQSHVRRASVALWHVLPMVDTLVLRWWWTSPCLRTPVVRCGKSWTAVKWPIQSPWSTTAPAQQSSTAPKENWHTSAALWAKSPLPCSQSVSTDSLSPDALFTDSLNSFGKCEQQWKPLGIDRLWWLLFKESVREILHPCLTVWLSLPQISQSHLPCEAVTVQSCALG